MGRASTGCDAEHALDDQIDSHCSVCSLCLINAPQVFFHPGESDPSRAHGVCCECFKSAVLATNHVTCPLCRQSVSEADIGRMARECNLNNDDLSDERRAAARQRLQEE